MKNTLRKSIKNKIQLLTNKALEVKSQHVIENLLSLKQIKEAKRIGLYYSKDHEVKTHKLIQKLLSLGKEICLPKTTKTSLIFRQIKNLNETTIGEYGIREPKPTCPLKNALTLDLLIIPCIGVDKSGNRLGRGGSFYDKFLSLNHSLETICLAYEEQILSKIPTEKHDQSIHWIVTEGEILKTKKRIYKDKILNGALLSEFFLNTKKIQIKKENIHAKLAVILVGEDPASQIYVRKKIKICQNTGIDFELIKFPENITESTIIKIVKELNKNKTVTGILIQLPLPKQLNTKYIINTITPAKDVDCLTDFSRNQLIQNYEYFPCCTPQGILTILKHYNISLKNKKIVLVGHGFLVGQPLAQMLQNLQLPFTVCTLDTPNIRAKTLQADILISATGVPHLITEKHIKKGTIVIDAGTAKLNDKTVGDVDFDRVIKKVSYITPIPGGVGPLTIAMLIDNIIKAYKMQTKMMPKPKQQISEGLY
ncbi:5-formyltetrahydrofolate cyclo-ligase [Candidatus Babeliales bacterium]|nr:5-formyltetrahydrofolate cyclo-ligase [Candidatus Babeliales bacterium]